MSPIIFATFKRYRYQTMLISPPFLPADGDSATDSWLDAAMPSPANEGGYPVTGGLAWHGGLHLVAPAALPVRAIADGTVAYVRKASAKNSDENDPLNYHAGAVVSGWTSDGCVIIQHDTEIGSGSNGKVRFFSIAMHLENIPANIAKGKKIYRKDSIGEAGWINGRASRMHFEIICDDANLAKLVGRQSGDLPVNADGRKDALYGEVYFHLPAGTIFFNTKPQPPAPAHPAHPAHHPAAPPPPPVQLYVTTDELYIGVRYAAHGYVSTYQTDGSMVGGTIREDDGEYDLYQSAVELNTQCTSAAYELLRFGRTIGEDALAPENTPHWRKANYPGGQGWVDLAPAAIKKFSDADFPHWCGWKLIDDSADLDSRMDAQLIRSWLDTDGDGKVTPAETRAQLAQSALQQKLKFVICKTPTEWNAATIDARWGWLKSANEEHPDKLEDADFHTLKTHIAKLAFWQEAALEIDANHWHFQPREFIRHFRKCGWYSTDELARCIPRRSLSENVAWTEAFSRATTHHTAMNLLFKKYMGANRIRHLHALSQTYIETGLLRLFKEGGAGAGKNYGAFYGRGYMQLTWAANYESYGKFKNISDHGSLPYTDHRITATSTHMWSDGGANKKWAPRYDPDIVGTSLVHGAESSGLYWISKHYRGKKDINRACDIGASATVVGFISWLVNGGGNGYNYRQQFAEYLRNILLDRPLKTGNATLQFPPLSPGGNPALCAHFPPVEVPYTSQVAINYECQIP